MVIGIGCDIVELNITRALGWEEDEKLLLRIFSEEERRLYKKDKKIRFLMGRFAAKESVVKCIGMGMQDGISLKDVQILSDNLGKPFIELKGHVKQIADNLGIKDWHISITHSTTFSVAFVIAES